MSSLRSFFPFISLASGYQYSRIVYGQVGGCRSDRSTDRFPLETLTIGFDHEAGHLGCHGTTQTWFQSLREKLRFNRSRIRQLLTQSLASLAGHQTSEHPHPLWLGRKQRQAQALGRILIRSTWRSRFGITTRSDA